MPDFIPGAGFVRAGLAAMPALEDAPELYRPAPAADDPLARQGARRDEDFALRAAAQATALTRALSGAPPEGEPDGFAARQLARFDEESAALLDGAPSPRAEEAARAAIGRARGRFADWALPQEAAAQTLARRQTLIDTLAQFRAAAEQQPDDADALHAEGAAAIVGAASWLGPEGARQLGEQWTEEVYGSAARARIDAEPEDAVKQLSAGLYGDALSLPRRAALINEAHQAMTNATLDYATEIEAKLRDGIAMRAQQQQTFIGEFTQRIDEDSARQTDLTDALDKGLISSYEAQRLKRQQELRAAVVRRENAAVRQVSTFIDGETEEVPSNQDIAAHYRIVMAPMLEGFAPAQRGKIVVDYMNRFGRFTGVQPVSSHIALMLPTDQPTAREDVYKFAGYDPNGFGQSMEALRHLPHSFTVNNLSDKALETTNKLFESMPQGNTAADAFRHAYWAYESAQQTSPETARALTNAHERDGGPEDQRLMDLFNNAVGIKLAQLPENKERDGRDVILGAMLDGRLQLQPFKLK